MTNELKSARTSAFWGAVLLFCALFFWKYLVGNPFEEFALIRRGQEAQGFIVDSWEDAESGDDGGTQWFHGVIYTYKLPDGRKLTQRTKEKSGRLRSDLRDLDHPLPIEVEYLPDDPTVSRIKGEGSPTVLDWLWRKIALGGLLLVVFLAPGTMMLRDAVRELMSFRRKTD